MNSSLKQTKLFTLRKISTLLLKDSKFWLKIKGLKFVDNNVNLAACLSCALEIFSFEINIINKLYKEPFYSQYLGGSGFS